MVGQYLDTVIAFVVIILGVSLLITVLTQMVSALFGYRGTDLLWGVKTLLAAIEPAVADKADAVARHVLQTPLLSDSIFSRFRDVPILGAVTQRWRLTSALTVGELVSCLSTVEIKAKGDQPSGGQTTESMGTVPDQKGLAASGQQGMIQRDSDVMKSTCQEQLDNAITQLRATAQISLEKIEEVFDAVMKRVSQRFAFRMRILTVLFAVVVSFGFKLNTMELVKRLWSDEPLRSRLAGQTEILKEEASAILPGQKGALQSASAVVTVAPQILTQALERLKEEEKEATKGLPKMPEFKNVNEAADWLQRKLKTNKTTQKKLATRYRTLAGEELKRHADRVREELASSGFQLQPVDSWSTLKGCFVWPNILGILMTAAFLSLGAPFWFNMLKTLGTLRPLTAKPNPGSRES